MPASAGARLPIANSECRGIFSGSQTSSNSSGHTHLTRIVSRGSGFVFLNGAVHPPQHLPVSVLRAFSDLHVT
jgi:hypothetical protein